MAGAPTVVIMAAGHGTRMRSALAKVLHPVCGRPMLEWVVAAARAAGAGRVICVTRPGEGVAERLPEGVEAVEQVEGEGTGSAILAAREHVVRAQTVLVLSGDHPLVSAALVAGLAETHERAGAAATLLTTEDLDPRGYGRVVRAADGLVERIVETKHEEGVSSEDLARREINIGAYAFAGGALVSALEALPQTGGERYLTGVFSVLRERGQPVAAHRTDDVDAAIGVNTRLDLMAVERRARERLIEAHALAGVSFSVPESVHLDADVEIGEDTVIGPGVTLTAGTRVGRGCQVGPHTTAHAARLGDGVVVPHSYLVECEVGDRASVGPFAYLRPGARLQAGAKAGTFVEVKNSTLGPGAKVPHLSYVGDAEVGEGANLGAGTITANYDGRRKHRTVIGRGVRTGVHSSLVAPVRIGDEAYTAAGSAITGDVPDGALGVARSKQRNVEGYAERARERSAE
jgi:bifunctional UDP-N-acetylglucosamine pyrophosphorylase/glucosamine-1-phosphate N-acetyltransferase